MTTQEEAPQPGHAGYEDDGYEWETVHEEAPDQLVFDTEGDTYIGTYLGHEVIHDPNKKAPDDWFIQLKWRDPAGLKFTNAGFELREAYTELDIDVNTGELLSSADKIPPGSLTRNEMVKKVDTGQASQMKSFNVAVAKPKSSGNTQG